LGRNSKGQIGASLNGKMIRINKKSIRNGVLCKDCKHFSFGYYCNRKRFTPQYKNKKRLCNFFEEIREHDNEIILNMKDNTLSDIDQYKISNNVSCTGCKYLKIILDKDILKCKLKNNAITTLEKAKNNEIKVPKWCGGKIYRQT